MSVELPTRKYSVVLADPPWRYEDTACHGNAKDHYDTMSLSEIKDLPVATIAAEPCALFLWVTFPMLQEGLDVIEACGFEYTTLGFSWIKLNRNSQRPFFGIGHYTKSNCELCLLSARGNIHKLVKRDDVSSCVITERLAHSKKPDEVRKRIVQIFGDVPRIELFARDAPVGWDVWGNQSKQDQSLDVFPHVETQRTLLERS